MDEQKSTQSTAEKKAAQPVNLNDLIKFILEIDERGKGINRSEFRKLYEDFYSLQKEDFDYIQSELTAKGFVFDQELSKTYAKDTRVKMIENNILNRMPESDEDVFEDCTSIEFQPLIERSTFNQYAISEHGLHPLGSIASVGEEGIGDENTCQSWSTLKKGLNPPSAEVFKEAQKGKDISEYDLNVLKDVLSESDKSSRIHLLHEQFEASQTIWGILLNDPDLKKCLDYPKLPKLFQDILRDVCKNVISFWFDPQVKSADHILRLGPPLLCSFGRESIKDPQDENSHEYNSHYKNQFVQTLQGELELQKQQILSVMIPDLTEKKLFEKFYKKYAEKTGQDLSNLIIRSGTDITLLREVISGVLEEEYPKESVELANLAKLEYHDAQNKDGLTDDAYYPILKIDQLFYDNKDDLLLDRSLLVAMIKYGEWCDFLDSVEDSPFRKPSTLDAPNLPAEYNERIQILIGVANAFYYLTLLFIDPNTSREKFNFGQLIEKDPVKQNNLIETIVKAIQKGEPLEESILHWLETHILVPAAEADSLRPKAFDDVMQKEIKEFFQSWCKFWFRSDERAPHIDEAMVFMPNIPNDIRAVIYRSRGMIPLETILFSKAFSEQFPEYASLKDKWKECKFPLVSQLSMEKDNLHLRSHTENRSLDTHYRLNPEEVLIRLISANPSHAAQFLLEQTKNKKRRVFQLLSKSQVEKLKKLENWNKVYTEISRLLNKNTHYLKEQFRKKFYEQPRIHITREQEQWLYEHYHTMPYYYFHDRDKKIEKFEKLPRAQKVEEALKYELGTTFSALNKIEITSSGIFVKIRDVEKAKKIRKKLEKIEARKFTKIIPRSIAQLLHQMAGDIVAVDPEIEKSQGPAKLNNQRSLEQYNLTIDKSSYFIRTLEILLKSLNITLKIITNEEEFKKCTEDCIFVQFNPANPLDGYEIQAKKSDIISKIVECYEKEMTHVLSSHEAAKFLQAWIDKHPEDKKPPIDLNAENLEKAFDDLGVPYKKWVIQENMTFKVVCENSKWENAKKIKENIALDSHKVNLGRAIIPAEVMIEFFRAIAEVDTDKVYRQLVDYPELLNMRNPKDQANAVMAAFNTASQETEQQKIIKLLNLVSFLVKKPGIDLTAVDEAGNTVLHLAIRGDFHEQVLEIIKKSNVDGVREHLLMCKNNKGEGVFGTHEDPNCYDSTNQIRCEIAEQCFWDLLQKSHYYLFKQALEGTIILFEKGFNISSKDSAKYLKKMVNKKVPIINQYPLQLAIDHCDPESVKLLLEKGAKVDTLFNTGDGRRLSAIAYVDRLITHDQENSMLVQIKQLLEIAKKQQNLHQQSESLLQQEFDLILKPSVYRPSTFLDLLEFQFKDLPKPIQTGLEDYYKQHSESSWEKTHIMERLELLFSLELVPLLNFGEVLIMAIEAAYNQTVKKNVGKCQALFTQLCLPLIKKSDDESLKKSLSQCMEWDKALQKENISYCDRPFYKLGSAIVKKFEETELDQSIVKSYCDALRDVNIVEAGELLKKYPALINSREPSFQGSPLLAILGVYYKFDAQKWITALEYSLENLINHPGIDVTQADHWGNIILHKYMSQIFFNSSSLPTSLPKVSELCKKLALAAIRIALAEGKLNDVLSVQNKKGEEIFGIKSDPNYYDQDHQMKYEIAKEIIFHSIQKMDGVEYLAEFLTKYKLASKNVANLKMLVSPYTLDALEICEYPLQVAIKAGNREWVEWLCDNGADLDISFEFEGKTVCFLDFARILEQRNFEDGRFTEIKLILEQKGAKPYALPEQEAPQLQNEQPDPIIKPVKKILASRQAEKEKISFLNIIKEKQFKNLPEDIQKGMKLNSRDLCDSTAEAEILAENEWEDGYFSICVRVEILCNLQLTVPFLSKEAREFYNILVNEIEWEQANEEKRKIILNSIAKMTEDTRKELPTKLEEAQPKALDKFAEQPEKKKDTQKETLTQLENTSIQVLKKAIEQADVETVRRIAPFHSLEKVFIVLIDGAYGHAMLGGNNEDCEKLLKLCLELIEQPEVKIEAIDKNGNVVNQCIKWAETCEWIHKPHLAFWANKIGSVIVKIAEKVEIKESTVEEFYKNIREGDVEKAEKSLSPALVAKLNSHQNSPLIGALDAAWRLVSKRKEILDFCLRLIRHPGINDFLKVDGLGNTALHICMRRLSDLGSSNNQYQLCYEAIILEMAKKSIEMRNLEDLLSAKNNKKESVFCKEEELNYYDKDYRIRDKIALQFFWHLLCSNTETDLDQIKSFLEQHCGSDSKLIDLVNTKIQSTNKYPLQIVIENFSEMKFYWLLDCNPDLDVILEVKRGCAVGSHTSPSLKMCPIDFVRTLKEESIAGDKKLNEFDTLDQMENTLKDYHAKSYSQILEEAKAAKEKSLQAHSDVEISADKKELLKFGSGQEISKQSDQYSKERASIFEIIKSEFDDLPNKIKEKIEEKYEVLSADAGVMIIAEDDWFDFQISARFNPLIDILWDLELEVPFSSDAARIEYNIPVNAIRWEQAAEDERKRILYSIVNGEEDIEKERQDELEVMHPKLLDKEPLKGHLEEEENAGKKELLNLGSHEATSNQPEPKSEFKPEPIPENAANPPSHSSDSAKKQAIISLECYPQNNKDGSYHWLYEAKCEGNIVNDIVFLSNGDAVVSSYVANTTATFDNLPIADHVLTLWNPSKGCIKTIDEGKKKIGGSIAASRDGKRIISFHRGGLLFVNIETGRYTSTRYRDESLTKCFAVLSDDMVVAGDIDGKLVLWDSKGEFVKELWSHQNGCAVECIVELTNGNILSCSSDKTIIIGDKENPDNFKVLRGHKGKVLKIVESPDGKRIATCSADRTVIIWDIKGCQPIMTLEGSKSDVTSVEFLDDRYLISCSLSDNYRIYDIQTGKCIDEQPSKFPSTAKSIKKLPDGGFVILSDGCFTIWKISKSPENQLQFEGTLSLYEDLEKMSDDMLPLLKDLAEIYENMGLPYKHPTKIDGDMQLQLADKLTRKRLEDQIPGIVKEGGSKNFNVPLLFVRIHQKILAEFEFFDLFKDRSNVMSPLECAIRTGNIKYVNIALDRVIRTNTKIGSCYLECAIRSQNIDIVHALFNAGAPFENNTVCQAMHTESINVVNTVIAMGAPITKEALELANKMLKCDDLEGNYKVIGNAVIKAFMANGQPAPGTLEATTAKLKRVDLQNTQPNILWCNFLPGDQKKPEATEKSYPIIAKMTDEDLGRLPFKDLSPEDKKKVKKAVEQLNKDYNLGHTNISYWESIRPSRKRIILAEDNENKPGLDSKNSTNVLIVR